MISISFPESDAPGSAQHQQSANDTLVNFSQGLELSVSLNQEAHLTNHLRNNINNPSIDLPVNIPFIFASRWYYQSSEIAQFSSNAGGILAFSTSTSELEKTRLNRVACSSQLSFFGGIRLFRNCPRSKVKMS